MQALKDFIMLHHSNRAHHSETAGLLVVSRVSNSTMAGSSSGHQDPLPWNQHPVWIQETDTLSIFNMRRKAFFFDKAYSRLDQVTLKHSLGILL